MEQNRPRGREKNVTNNSTGVHKRGEGLGTGPVGSSNGYAGKNGTTNGQRPSSSGGNKNITRATGGGGGLIVVIGIVLFLLFGRGGNTSTNTSSSQNQSSSTSTGNVIGSILGGLTGAVTGNSGTSNANGSLHQSGSTAAQTSYSSVDTSVAAGSRAKRTVISGNGGDKVTIMVYMCGTDLESQNGMATSDLSEMAKANLGGNINLIVYTGGCKKWQTSGISTTTNQIYQVTNGGIKQLVASDGQKAMTDPATLSSFIQWAAKNFPANRNELIFWDHGGGSVSGYGYDEKYANKGSMNLANISKALKAGGVQFDFIGFDACLMATAETALMLNDYADYMIASEETEPGIGWYYTNWLTKLGANTSMPTLQIGQNIIDDFVAQCNAQCRGQKTTLSIIDLAEFANTVPAPLSAFSKSISTLISNQSYQQVSDARYATREFASSSRIDQIDLVDLCNNVGTSEGASLAKALKGAVKYNRTSSNMTNAYGVSIYFPYQRASYVDQVSSTYQAIGMDDDYLKCIRQFASLETSGQVAAGGSSSPVGSLLDMLGGSSTSGSADAIGSLLGAFLGGGASSGLISGLTGRNISFMQDGVSQRAAANYIALNHFDASALIWQEYSDGSATLSLPEDQWALVHALDLNLFYDDGAGYIDLGLDNVYDWTDSGDLIAETDRTWLAINGQPVAYYHEDTTELGDQYTITGRVPAMLNGQLVNLILVFDNAHPYGTIAGARADYKNGETDTVAKSMTELKAGDTLEFLCDYYSYNGQYQDSYYLGEPMKVTQNMQISNVDVGKGNVKLTYRFTDIYNQEYWTPALER